MSTRPLSRANTLTVVGLVVTAVGIWIQALAGDPDYAAFGRFPPGPIILVILAAIIAIGNRYRYLRWIPVLGVLLSMLITVGAFVLPGTARRLSDPRAIAPFLGTVIQMVSLVTTIVAGIVATIWNYRYRPAQ
jgi:hypothetical protein